MSRDSARKRTVSDLAGATEISWVAGSGPAMTDRRIDPG
jgi:hypothetical protein